MRSITVHVDGLDTVQIHLPKLTTTIAFQLETEVVAVVGANLIVAADPVIQHAHAPDVLLVLEAIDGVFSAESEQSAEDKHVVTAVAVAAMILPESGTVNNITVDSATGAVDTHVPLYSPVWHWITHWSRNSASLLGHRDKRTAFQTSNARTDRLARRMPRC